MEHISNVEKAKDIAQSVSFFWTNEDDAEKSIIDTVSLRKAIFNAVMQAMEWKDAEHANERQQWIDKAAEWFGNYLFEIGYPDDWLRDSPNIKNGKTRFIQTMKGE